MSKVLSFDRQINISEKLFRDRVWRAFLDALTQKQDLILDFRNVKFIVNTAVTKLCCLGEIAKKRGINVEIIPSEKIAKYFAEMDFWNIAAMNNIFTFDERYLYWPIDEKRVTNALFCLEKESLKHKYYETFEFIGKVDECDQYKHWVKAELTGVNNTIYNGSYTIENIPKQCKAVLKTVSGFFGYSDYTAEDKILDSIIELVHNAIWHSQGKCYFFVQRSEYKVEPRREGINISVSDTGCGLYQSLVNKNDNLSYFNKDDFIMLANRSEQNYYSIIEALFYRKKPGIRGLYNIITDLVDDHRHHFRELHLINGNVTFDLREGLKENEKGVLYEMHDMSNLINKGIEVIIKENKKCFSEIPDVGFSFCVDMGISIPKKGKG